MDWKNCFPIGMFVYFLFLCARCVFVFEIHSSCCISCVSSVFSLAALSSWPMPSSLLSGFSCSRLSAPPVQISSLPPDTISIAMGRSATPTPRHSMRPRWRLEPRSPWRLSSLRSCRTLHRWQMWEMGKMNRCKWMHGKHVELGRMGWKAARGRENAAVGEKGIKAIYCTVMICSDRPVLYVYLSLSLSLSLSPSSSSIHYTHSSSTSRDVIIAVSLILLATGSTIWLIWMLRSTWRGQSELRYTCATDSMHQTEEAI